jgi:hypothetical protein
MTWPSHYHEEAIVVDDFAKAMPSTTSKANERWATICYNDHPIMSDPDPLGAETLDLH